MSSLSEAVLEVMPVAVHRAFSSSFVDEIDALPEIKLRVYEDAVYDMVVQLRTYVLAEKLAEETVDVPFEAKASFDFPATPWQHMKDRYAPAWYVRRWPVVTSRRYDYVSGHETVRVQQFAIFPASPIRTPEQLRGTRVVRYERALHSA